MGPFMTINLAIPDIQELKPRITVFGVGGAGGNAVNNMIASGLDGVDFVCANTDAQALALSKSPRIIRLGVSVTEGLGAGSHPEGAGRAEPEAPAAGRRPRRHRLPGCTWPCVRRPAADDGAWPSGKARDFGSRIRRFESFRPSQHRARL